MAILKNATDLFFSLTTVGELRNDLLFIMVSFLCHFRTTEGRTLAICGGRGEAGPRRCRDVLCNCTLEGGGSLEITILDLRNMIYFALYYFEK